MTRGPRQVVRIAMAVIGFLGTAVGQYDGPPHIIVFMADDLVSEADQ